jgi:NAD-dependent dihydropyrimidine dehydrogenase PreA subunit
VDAIRPPYNNKVKESRLQGVKRIMMYLVFLPVMVAVGAFILHIMSDTLSQANKDVRLYNMVIQYERHPDIQQPLEVESFYGQGGTPEELTERIGKIQSRFSIFSAGAGALIGLVIGLTLIGLSVKRTRKTYEIDDAACVNCGRCFSYCPQNQTGVKPRNK